MQNLHLKISSQLEHCNVAVLKHYLSLFCISRRHKVLEINGDLQICTAQCLIE